MSADRYGISRVVNEPGVLPQRAQRLDPSLPLGASELLIDVESLNIDAASFRQLKEAAHGDGEAITRAVRDIVQQRGKLHNPVTGSGGMLIGRVRKIGAEHPAHATLLPGDRIATLVSLTLTPLVIDEVRAVHLGIDRVGLGSDFDGATMPAELSDAAALPRLVGALRERGYDEESLAKLGHRNWLRVLGKTWRA